MSFRYFALLPFFALTAGAAEPTGERLADCPSAPRCVSSQAADERHRVEPFTLADPGEQGWARVVEEVRKSERTTIQHSDGRYLRAEVLSPWHVYTDDLELLRGADGRVDVRSSARIGYYDFRVNRRRVDALRARLLEAGAIKGDPAR